MNGFDEADVINQYVAQNKFTFHIGMADRGQSGDIYDVGEKYGVSAYPTNYVVDAATGKVLFRSIGFDEKGIRDALAKQGVK